MMSAHVLEIRRSRCIVASASVAQKCSVLLHVENTCTLIMVACKVSTQGGQRRQEVHMR
jgi:hypothetical protein